MSDEAKVFITFLICLFLLALAGIVNYAEAIRLEHEQELNRIENGYIYVPSTRGYWIKEGK